MTEDFIGTPIDLTVIIVYFLGILAFGSYFARYTKTTTDFFFAGQRFAWWLVAFSFIATTVGSYSFIKYSEAAYTYGLASTQSYTNDWMWMPLLVLGWIPIIYYQRIRSIPEYFERRFGTINRGLYTSLLLLYMLGYVGINLYTL
ncbi:MAG: sodium:solute symporter family protein, partial [Candidatus Omnitrophica bacterium]|nr:sodium:solute symporter family protein [Candidatus Omnitrophota bacterium]